MNLPTYGRHLIAEYHHCDPSILNNVDAIASLMKLSANATGATIVNSNFHEFTPTGVSGVVVIQESHLSIHTWPEKGYAAVDFYTCGDNDPNVAHSVLARELRAKRCELMLLHRGDPDGSIQTRKAEWNQNSLTQWQRETFLPDPTQFFLVSGSGEGNTALNAFDHALLDAGIGDTNLVKMSSIVPPQLKQVESRPLPYGALVPVAYAEITSDRPGDLISAAIAAAFPVDESLPGLIMEHHAHAPLAEVERKVHQMAIDGMKHRERAVKDVLVVGKEHRVQVVGSAFAGLVLWGDS